MGKRRTTKPEPRTVRLNGTSVDLPLVAFGTAHLAGKPGRDAVSAAVRAGIRHFDCAHLYRNESLVGAGLQDAIATGIVTRDELCISSKLFNDDHHPSLVEAACRTTLDRLRVDYLDLYLVHWPFGWRKNTFLVPADCTLEETWAAMESLVDKGLVRAIGFSNFEQQDMERIFKVARIPPTVNQLELHPLHPQSALVEFCKQHDVQCFAWSPLAQANPKLTQSPALAQVVRSTKMTPTQVVLRWNLERGVGVIPRSVQEAHIRENIDVFDRPAFAADQTALLATLESGRISKFPACIGVFEDSPVHYRVFGRVLSGLMRVIYAVTDIAKVDFGREPIDKLGRMPAVSKVGI
jgi:diketogulonate reductase-like aldo/keto reductase